MLKQLLYYTCMIVGTLHLFMFFNTYALNSVSSGFRINHGQTNLTVDAHGVCKKVTNYSGNSVFIPTKASTEWGSFRLHAPSGIGFAECRVPCGVDQYLSGSSCYYVGAGYYSPTNNDIRYACTNKPGGNTAYTSAGNGSNNCNWEYEYYYYVCENGPGQWQVSEASVAGPGPITFPDCPSITLGASCNFTSVVHNKCKTTVRARNGNPLYGICGFLHGTTVDVSPSWRDPGLCSNGVEEYVDGPGIRSGRTTYWRCRHVDHSTGYASCSATVR